MYHVFDENSVYESCVYKVRASLIIVLEQPGNQPPRMLEKNHFESLLATCPETLIPPSYALKLDWAGLGKLG